MDHAGILDTIESTHSSDLDVVVADNVITARANGYVDFAIEVAKKMDLFEDEADLEETIAFWKELSEDVVKCSLSVDLLLYYYNEG